MSNILCPHCQKPINPASLLKTQDKETKECIVCSKSFTGSKKSKFCSNACRCKAYQRKKKLIKG
ncbi:hypothetical protein [Helicobacter cinaedi]|uniref:hypothetical protein n=1 Tax=Helicobacter cinaedi TaxID=213 RepID=UPI001E431B79|nr:hypothetical protein [Helicobacter cinaedi]